MGIDKRSKMLEKKKPGRTRAMLVVLLILLFLIAIYKGMEGASPEELSIYIIAIFVIILGIFFIEGFIEKRIYPTGEDRLEKMMHDMKGKPGEMDEGDEEEGN